MIDKSNWALSIQDSFSHNLFSVKKIVQKGFSVTFKSVVVHVKRSEKEDLIMEGSLQGTRYMVKLSMQFSCGKPFKEMETYGSKEWDINRSIYLLNCVKCVSRVSRHKTLMYMFQKKGRLDQWTLCLLILQVAMVRSISWLLMTITLILQCGMMVWKLLHAKTNSSCLYNKVHPSTEWGCITSKWSYNGTCQMFNFWVKII